ncbi:pyridoxal phosphate-dependent aminotransferase [Clostridium cellulovorans]|uniref:Aminotransferase n=1 Tax=Clostridium cellulovorans (strain ATCC 35296 / DSM 3052 / OCM 3 / 743B) TaxID=573061 RepID=D9SLW1_CLOC7|nr:pyridoxal phosphate-dependent aminotransferase [Clostridium cellulovorans]ADL51692.1 aminotransferase class I and II [Clostridium cellulovorans 743B]
MISNKIAKNLERSSWIRAMFEEGRRLSSLYGAENVYDFSLGNPFSEPPKEVIESMRHHISEGEKGIHKYMSNSGFPEVRKKIAVKMQGETGISLSEENVIMTVGAAGGLNVALKAILNPEEEVIVFSPYFVEYGFYADNHQGKIVVVEPNPENFEPNLKEFEKAIIEKTKAIIINNPNNPTGVIYRKETMEAMAKIVEDKEKQFKSNIYILSDEPYGKIVYDSAEVPSVFKIFKNAMIINSYSKSLALAGERIGYIAVSNKTEEVETLVKALEFCNRTLGFVNAPGLFQKVIADSLDSKVDVEDYKMKRDYLYDNLTRIGFECVKPQGAFYLFPKALIEDDIEFVKTAVKYNLLLVPGSGFGYKGHFRMSYCVEFDMIKRSIAAFEKLAKEYNR